MAQEPLIVFVGHDGGRTGAPLSLLRLVEWFASHAPCPIEVILRNGGPLEADYRKHAPVHVWNEPYPNPLDARRLLNRALRRLGHVDEALLSRRQRAIVRGLAQRRVGAVFGNTGLAGHILGTLKSALGVPVVTRIPELEAYMRRNNLDGSAGRALALSDHFVAVSQAVRENLVRRHGVAAERITVIHGACAVPRLARGVGGLRDKLGIPGDAFVVGGCGTMDWRKGIDLFIQVANRVAKSRDCAGIYFCWIGSCVSESSCLELHYEIELHGLRERLFFLGEVPDAAPYLADLDLFLLTSREDPFSLAMIEAARQGVPVVRFEGSGGATEFVDNTVGVAVPMLDVGAMARAVRDLKASPGRRAALAEGAYRMSLRYTPERMGEATYAVLKSVMKSG
ncbi:MAG: glycosyltransferase family 4 protein [Betaproteobacteria bacterium]|nr:glycosyltransferase family 4 protein [Betaproteobacteria bacterium]